MLKAIQNLDSLYLYIIFVVGKDNNHQKQNQNFTKMGTNKMYKIERISTEDRSSEVVFIGRMRDAKKCIATLKNEYNERGFEALNTGFSLMIYRKGRVLAECIYAISEK